MSTPAYVAIYCQRQASYDWLYATRDHYLAGRVYAEQRHDDGRWYCCVCGARVRVAW